MTKFNKYRIYCEVEGWVEVISDTPVSQCPIDNSHTVKVDSVTLIEENIEVNDGTIVVLDLDNFKQLRFKEIDLRTEELIKQGFSYNNLTFSLSQNAQINILALHETRNDPALTYPIEYSTIDDSAHYDVVDATDLHNMYLTALATKKGWVDSGTALKDSIRAATNEQEVQSIIDNR
jgi:hypothetical protein